MVSKIRMHSMVWLIGLMFIAAPVYAQESGSASEGLTLSGPYFLRSADPVPPGEMQLKFNFGYEKESRGGEDFEFEFVLEWGIAQNWEFIFEMPFEVFDGNVQGNGDVAEFGFHTYLWDEQDWMPAFAVRNLIRIPTGHDSKGFDYLLRGLFTHSLTDGMRLHINPYATFLNGNIGHHDRNFLWGIAIGVDYQYSDDLLLIADYQNKHEGEEGTSNQHMLELGADWDIGDNQTIGFNTSFELDGDSHGDNFIAKISYIIELEAPRLDG